jgi:O-antigen/teichoic acid export membrane protein
LWSGGSVSRRGLFELLQVGSWFASANLLGWVFGQADRMILAARVSLSAVPFFVVPLDLTMRLSALPSALATVLFPITASLKEGQIENGYKIYRSGQVVMAAALGSTAIFLSAFSSDLLTFWLGSDFAAKSAICLAIFACGFTLNGQAQLGAAVIQAIGKPQLLTRLYLAECAPYLLAFWYAAANFGIVGAALTWLARVFIDAIIILVLAERCYPRRNRQYIERLLGALAVIPAAILAGHLDTTSAKILLIAGFAAAGAVYFLFLHRARIRRTPMPTIGTKLIFSRFNIEVTKP